jgi:uncharacterized LabA/DUF88 family protein
MPIGLFVDGQYAYKVYGGRLDYKKLRFFIESELNDEVDEGYFFTAEDENRASHRLYNALSYPPPDGPGLRVKTYWIQRNQLYWPKSLGGQPVMHPSDNVPFLQVSQKAVDVGLVYHMARSFAKRRWDKLVLVAGDADFHEPVQNLVEQENVTLYLVGTLNTIHQALRPYARKIYKLNEEPLRSLLKLEERAIESDEIAAQQERSGD